MGSINQRSHHWGHYPVLSGIILQVRHCLRFLQRLMRISHQQVWISYLILQFKNKKICEMVKGMILGLWDHDGNLKLLSPKMGISQVYKNDLYAKHIIPISIDLKNLREILCIYIPTWWLISRLVSGLGLVHPNFLSGLTRSLSHL